MLSEEDNILLTRTGPKAPMGELFRRFWQPVALSAELFDVDGAPIRISVLGEDLRAFRATDGSVGVVSPRCPHRGADLFFGRNENGGITCAYHGWKFATNGRCLAIPTLEPGPARDRAEQNVRLPAYPTREAGGFIWAYLGPREQMPELPELEFLTLPASHVFVSKKLQQCNWAQSCEGGLDTAHFSFLHMPVSDAADVAGRLMAKVSSDPDTVRWMRADGTPRFTIAEHPAGLVLGAARRGDAGKNYWRISQFLMPNHGLAPNAFPGENYHGQCWVPIDDVSCWIYNYTWNPDRPLTETERARYRGGSGVHAEVDAQYVPLRRRENDYLIDRHRQKYETYTGIDGVSEQDAAIQDSQGRIADRAIEHLGPTDMGIIRFRRLILDAARGLENGEAPSAAAHPRAYCVRGGGAIASTDTPLAEVMRARFGHEHGLTSKKTLAAA
ncbi:MAG: ring-hydroxylating oxygenase subunit alpha [Acetobacteraceae bacterium]|nr:ring-hydroxylating oxygenase subunit alpha [Acetobacteraceae bacterium]